MKFTLLQWNCQYSEDPSKIGEFLSALNPDIICLQELTQNYTQPQGDTGQSIATQLNYQSFCAYGPMVLPDGQPALMGNGILTRHLIIQTNKYLLQKGSDATDTTPVGERTYLEATIDLCGQKIVVGTTHLPFHPQFRTTPLKQQLVNQLLEQVPTQYPYILAGDFNTTPYTKAAKTFRQAGLRNAGPAFRQNTWTTKPFSIGPWHYTELAWRLDYVLFKGAIKPVKSRILPTDLSDHLPVLIEFEMKS